jgi:hypothetical protein
MLCNATKTILYENTNDPDNKSHTNEKPTIKAPATKAKPATKAPATKVKILNLPQRQT